ncbi:ribosomal RNA small subunit methyltransferase A [Candidatus Saccharibacteria bacterium]|nr:ribosomal RNA small subunit methyltransferase A [Candidatus Saccharibacteria bacterium]
MKNNKSLGQHWLYNRQILDDIADFAAGNTPETLENSPAKLPKSPKTALEERVRPLCLEIGPGLGTLTSSLLRVFPRVISVEFDQRLAENLPKSFPGKNLEVVNQDFLKFDLESIDEPYVVAGNIPYYITSPIIKKLIEAKNQPLRIVLLIQKEVAERIAAKKGRHTVLSLSVQNRASVTLGPVVGREFFTPPPDVDSEIIILEPLSAPIVPDQIFSIIKRGFSAPRKKLIKNIGQLRTSDLQAIFSRIGISADARPADLDLVDWEKLYQELFSSCQNYS